MEKPIVIEIFNDNGSHSHWALVDCEDGKKLWSEDPKECMALGYPVSPPSQSEVKEFKEHGKHLWHNNFASDGYWCLCGAKRD